MSKILIVDDNPRSLKALSENLKLRHQDWEIGTADHQETAFAAIRSALDSRQPYDVVVTDLWLDKADSANNQGGDLLVSGITQIDPHLIAIVYTAKDQPFNRYRLLDAGAYDVIESNRPGMKFADEIDFRVRTALTQRDRMRKLSMLSRFFDANLMNQIQKNPQLLDLSQRMVTVVFWDIRGFTVMCDTLKAYPVLIGGFLQEYCDLAAKVIFEHSGVLDKFIGDGVMAIFGVPPQAQDEGATDALSAVEAAKALRSQFVPLLEKWLPKWKLKEPQQIDIGLGCGIHSGEMLVGTLGTGLRDQFTALGPHVNLTSRIENKADKGQILLSGSTNERVKGNVTTNMIDEKMELKGKQGTYDLYEVV